MTKTNIRKKNERKMINVFYKEDGISIIELLELDFSEFVNNFIREYIK